MADGTIFVGRGELRTTPEAILKDPLGDKA